MKYRVTTVSGIHTSTIEAEDLEQAMLIAEDRGWEVLDAYDEPSNLIVVSDEVYKDSEW